MPFNRYTGFSLWLETVEQIDSLISAVKTAKEALSEQGSQQKEIDALFN